MRAALTIWLVAAGLSAWGFQRGDQGMIAGVVVNQATGAPLKDAIVTLRYENWSDPTENMVRQTNQEGRFSFTGLWDREWELSAVHSGFAPGTYGATLYDPRGKFSLAKDEQKKDVVLKLVPQAVIAGRVTDAEGRPLEGTQVSLVKASFTGGVLRWTEVASAQTLDNGEYRIPRVPAGRYVVKGTLPGTRFESLPSESPEETGYAATYSPNVTDPSLAMPIEVSDPQEIRGVDIQLAPTRLFHVRGSLQLPGSLGSIPGHVMLLDRTDPTHAIATTQSSSRDHLFEVAHVAPGSYLAYAKLDMQPVYQGEQVVDVTGDIDGLVLRLRTPDATIAGVLRPKSDDRKVDLRKIVLLLPAIGAGSDPNGTYSPVSIGADLTFRQIVPTIFGTAGFRVRLSNLPEGCYVASIQYGGAEVPESGIEYSPDATLVITIGVDGGRLDGTAVGDDEMPVGGAVVALLPADGKGAPLFLQGDAQGAFHFRAVPPGDYQMIAWRDVSRDDLENPAFVNPFANQATAISIAKSGSVNASIKIVGK